MKRLRYLATTLLIATIVTSIGTFVWFKYLRDTDPIQYDNFRQIQIGMSQQEVDEILGCPSGVYGRRKSWTKITCCLPSRNTAEIWQGTYGQIFVWFSLQDNAVTGMERTNE